MNKQTVAVIGGGITGLSAAFYLQRMAREKQISLDVHILEKSNRWGGKIHTVEKHGCIMEKGPDSFLSRKTPILDLTSELNLNSELVSLNPHAGKTYIVHDDRFHVMPPGLILGIPTKLLPFIRTGIISPKGKLRASMDLLLPKRKFQDDESLGDFISRRLGGEVQERIVEPLLAGIYAGDLRKLSLQATFPQFQTMEQQYGSLIKGMIRSRKKIQTAQNLPEIARRSMFLTYRHGLQTLVDALLASLSKNGCSLHTQAEVTDIHKHSEQNRYSVSFRDHQPLHVDGIVLTVPPPLISRWLPELPELIGFSQMQYVSVANVLMIYDKKELNLTMNGTGFLVPKREGRTITACTWTSTKWSHTAPEDKALIRCYVGRAGQEQWLNWSDEELLNKVNLDLKELMGLRAAPIYTEVTRWPHSMPQYGVGHGEQMDKAKAALKAHMPRVEMAGAGLSGLGIPDCIQQGKLAAANMVSALKR